MSHRQQEDQPSGLSVLARIEEARALGVPWENLAGSVELSGRGVETAGYLQFRSGLDPEEDQVTVERAGRVLFAAEDAPLSERVWGLDEGETDFSDIARAANQVAVQIHSPAQLRIVKGAARHAAPAPAPVSGAGQFADHGGATVYEDPEGLGS